VRISTTLPAIARRIGVVSVGHRINVAYLTLAIANLQLTTTKVGEDLPSALHGIGLRIGMSAGPRSSGVLHVPAAVGVRLHDTSRRVALRHVSLVSSGN
jgi:hypothetical protein